MHVYRVENKYTSLGPWKMVEVDGERVHPVTLYEYNKRIGHHPSTHPCPHKEGMTGWRKMHFGCQSLALLMEWFPCIEGRKAFSHIMHLAVYDVDLEHVVFGEMQVAFRKEEATLLKTLDIERLHEYNYKMMKDLIPMEELV